MVSGGGGGEILEKKLGNLGLVLNWDMLRVHFKILKLTYQVNLCNPVKVSLNFNTLAISFVLSSIAPVSGENWEDG